jgi:hypothetical protein
MKSSKQLTYNNHQSPLKRKGLSSILAHLSFSSTSKVPLLTKLPSASNVWNGKHPLAFLDEFQDGPAEERVDRDVEASVSFNPVSLHIPKGERNEAN